MISSIVGNQEENVVIGLSWCSEQVFLPFIGPIQIDVKVYIEFSYNR